MGNETEHPNQPVTVVPSDTTLDTSYVALEPGNYNIRKGLRQGKKPLVFTENTIQEYRPTIPMGVGDYQSVVFIYPQGTIEIVGKVYCWNRLVKPGIYSAFEKLRYLSNNEEVLPRGIPGQFNHHMPYNRTVTVPANKYVNRRDTEAESIIEYKYVSFEEQITTEENGKHYPIPVLDGRITIYPDGTFKTKGIVIDSKHGELIDKYGYLGDYENYSDFDTSFTDVVKDDVSPRNVLKRLSENEDGSVTYGAIKPNEVLVRNRWLKLPADLIPINGGTVTLNEYGVVKTTGLVVNRYGHPIYQNEFKYNDYRHNWNHEDWVDTNLKYLPQMWDYSKRQLVTINPDVPYQYHYYNDSVEVHLNQTGPLVTFKHMPGWDKLIPVYMDEIESSTHQYPLDLIQLEEGFRLNSDENKLDITVFPFVIRRPIKVSHLLYKYPTLRLNPQGELDTYLTIDHTPLYLYDNQVTRVKPKTEATINTSIDYKDDQTSYQKYPTPVSGEFVFPIDAATDHKFIPYKDDDGSVSSIQFTKENNETYLTVVGKVIWKRGEEYFRLMPGKVKYITDWPDIRTDENGHPVDLFTVNGYFKDEPIFINREGLGVDKENIGNDYITIDGVRRQEEGLFTLIERNVTGFLTKREKQLLCNDSGHYRHYEYNDATLQIKEYHNYYYNYLYTSIDSGMTLKYYGLNLNDFVPPYFSPVSFMMNKDTVTESNLKRKYRHDRNQQRLYLYEDMYLSVVTPNGFKEVVKYDKGNIVHLDINSEPLFVKGNYGVNDFLSRQQLRRWDKESLVLAEGEYEVCNDIRFTIPKYHTVSDGPISIVGTPGLTLFVRYSNDLETISKTIEIPNTGIGELSLPDNLHKYGYVEVFVDEPFHDSYGQDKFIQRTQLRRDRNIATITIIEPVEIETATSNIIGTGEPRATLILVDNLDPNTIIAKKRIKTDGSFDLSGISGLRIDRTYYLIQTDDWGNTNRISFNVIPHVWRMGDYITGTQLFGQDIYLYPYNIRNLNNLSTDENLVDSALTINPMNQTYTIHGVMRDRTGRIYEEGTYTIGTTAPSYLSKYLSGLEADMRPQYRRQRNDVYRIGTTFKARKQDTLYPTTTCFNWLENKDEKWVIPRQFITDVSNWLTNATDTSSREYINAQILFNLTTELADTFIIDSSVKIGRYQNKLIFDDVAIFSYMVDGSEYRYLNQSGQEGKGYKREGYTATELIHGLEVSRNKPWFMDVEVVSENESRWVINKPVTDYTSIVTPIKHTIKHFALFNSGSNLYRVNGRPLMSPSNINANYQLSIYQLVNWGHIYTEDEYTGQLNVISFAINYEYWLRDNYDIVNPQMVNNVYNHWKRKGLSPDMFVFDNTINTDSSVHYHLDGVAVTIVGPLKVGGKWVKPGTQIITRKEEIEFVNFCPNSMVSATENGINFSLDSSLTYHVNNSGLTYGRKCINGEMEELNSVSPEIIYPSIVFSSIEGYNKYAPRELYDNRYSPRDNKLGHHVIRLETLKEEQLNSGQLKVEVVTSIPDILPIKKTYNVNRNEVVITEGFNPLINHVDAKLMKYVNVNSVEPIFSHQVQSKYISKFNNARYSYVIQYRLLYKGMVLDEVIINNRVALEQTIVPYIVDVYETETSDDSDLTRNGNPFTIKIHNPQRHRYNSVNVKGVVILKNGQRTETSGSISSDYVIQYGDEEYDYIHVTQNYFDGRENTHRQYVWTNQSTFKIPLNTNNELPYIKRGFSVEFDTGFRLDKPQTFLKDVVEKPEEPFIFTATLVSDNPWYNNDFLYNKHGGFEFSERSVAIRIGNVSLDDRGKLQIREIVSLIDYDGTIRIVNDSILNRVKSNQNLVNDGVNINYVNDRRGAGIVLSSGGTIKVFPGDSAYFESRGVPLTSSVRRIETTYRLETIPDPNNQYLRTKQKIPVDNEITFSNDVEYIDRTYQIVRAYRTEPETLLEQHCSGVIEITGILEEEIPYLPTITVNNYYLDDVVGRISAGVVNGFDLSLNGSKSNFIISTEYDAPLHLLRVKYISDPKRHYYMMPVEDNSISTKKDIFINKRVVSTYTFKNERYYHAPFLRNTIPLHHEIDVIDYIIKPVEITNVEYLDDNDELEYGGVRFTLSNVIPETLNSYKLRINLDVRNRFKTSRCVWGEIYVGLHNGTYNTYKNGSITDGRYSITSEYNENEKKIYITIRTTHEDGRYFALMKDEYHLPTHKRVWYHGLSDVNELVLEYMLQPNTRDGENNQDRYFRNNENQIRAVNLIPRSLNIVPMFTFKYDYFGKMFRGEDGLYFPKYTNGLSRSLYLQGESYKKRGELVVQKMDVDIYVNGVIADTITKAQFNASGNGWYTSTMDLNKVGYRSFWFDRSNIYYLSIDKRKLGVPEDHIGPYTRVITWKYKPDDITDNEGRGVLATDLTVNETTKTFTLFELPKIQITRLEDFDIGLDEKIIIENVHPDVIDETPLNVILINNQDSTQNVYDLRNNNIKQFGRYDKNTGTLVVSRYYSEFYHNTASANNLRNYSFETSEGLAWASYRPFFEQGKGFDTVWTAKLVVRPNSSLDVTGLFIEDGPSTTITHLHQPKPKKLN